MYSRGAAVFLSVVFSPPLVALYALTLLYERFGLQWPAVMAAFFVMGPALYVLFLLGRGSVSDFHMTNGSERIGPLKLTVLSVAVGLGLMIHFGAPAAAVDFTLACLVAVFAFYAVTLYYKVSAHSATLAAFCAMLTFFHNWDAGVASAALLPFVSWARVRLNRHTTMQTVTGCLLGWFAVFALLKIKGY